MAGFEVSTEVHGKIHVDGCPASLRRFVWITSTGRTFPGSLP
jgi:hypothetical protein